MQVKYAKWLEITITNDYFQDGVFRDFILEPTLESKKVLKNYNIMFNVQGNKIALYVGIGDNEELVLANAFANLNDLKFNIIVQDTLFFNYTDISFIGETSIFYFTNRNSNSSQLTKQKNASDKDVFSVKEKVIGVTIPSGFVLVEIKNIRKELVLKKEFNNTESSVFFLSLNGLDDGVYTLFVNGKNTEMFYSCSEIKKNQLGVIDIDISKIVKENSLNGVYEIAFTARSVYWQYEIVIPSSKKIEVSKMEIIGIEKEKYIGPERKEIPGGNTAQVYTSSKPLKLQNKREKNPQLELKYMYNFSNRVNELEIQLPNPSILSIRKYHERENETSFLSSTIVTV